jgi:hypothetical protein
MKQTAVQWLVEQIECFGNKHELQMSWTTLDELLKQAKEIEKRQIIDAYNTFGDYLKAEEYYNKTFK